MVEADPHRPSGRLVPQGDMDASYIDLADVTHLEFDHMRWLRIVLRAVRARRVLHIGARGVHWRGRWLPRTPWSPGRCAR